MKRLFFALIGTTTLSACNQQHQFPIEGAVDGLCKNTAMQEGLQIEGRFEKAHGLVFVTTKMSGHINTAKGPIAREKTFTGDRPSEAAAIAFTEACVDIQLNADTGYVRYIGGNNGELVYLRSDLNPSETGQPPAWSKPELDGTFPRAE